MEERKDPEGKEVEQEPQEEEFSFLQETIKDKAGGKGAYKKDIGRMAILGVVFGLVASFSFCAVKPWFEEQFQKNPKKVTIPKEEETDETEGEQGALPEVVQPLDAENYRQLNQSLNIIAQEANKSVVELAGAAGDMWAGMSYDDKNSVSGLIVADNGMELLILGKTDITKEVNEVTATFSDGRTYSASLKKRDANLGLGIYAVIRSDIQDVTWTQLKIATLGSSNASLKGDIAIVLGKPFGYAGGMGYGIVSSNKNVKQIADGEYRLVCTDIAGTKEGSGVIVNLSGEVTGIVDQSISASDSMNLVTGYGISDLKDCIEMLSNGQAIPYIGIKGIDVTDNIAAQGLPKGIYVREVEVDSPAMTAGIQNGDIITSIGGSEIISVAGYHSSLMSKEIGQKIKLKGQRKGTGDGYVDIDFNVTIGSKE